jgi:hypothetical protein
MSLELKLVKPAPPQARDADVRGGDDGGRGGAQVVSDVSAASSDDDAPSDDGLDTGSYLRPCPACGVGNGASACLCWNCQTVLEGLGGHQLVPELAAAVEGSHAGHGAPSADFSAAAEPQPRASAPAPWLPPAAVVHATPLATAPHAPPPAPAMSVPRRPAPVPVGALAALVGLVVAAAAVAYWFFAGDADATAPTRAAAALRANAARAVSGSVAHTRGAGAVSTVDESLAAAERALALRPADAAPQDGAPAARGDEAGRNPEANAAHDASHSRRDRERAAPAAAPSRDTPSHEPSRHAAAPAAPCPSNVVALGLCATPPPSRP